MTLKKKIILRMLLVVLLSVGVSTSTGGFLLFRNLRQEAENRVRQDLNAAREFYKQRLAEMEAALGYTALGERFSQAVEARETGYLAPRIAAVSANAGMDMLIVTDREGRVTCRSHNPASAEDSIADDVLVRRILEGGEAFSATLIMSGQNLAKESPALAKQARVAILPTPRARPGERPELVDGMVMAAAAPVRGPNGELVGVLRAGMLINRNYDLVDRVREVVFHGEHHRGKHLGTATVFQDDVRISTNVIGTDGSRAIGTRVAAEVYQAVLLQGGTWVGPAWVVNDWYITAYEPIYDINSKRVGMLYVGILANQFDDLTRQTFTIFILVIAAGICATCLIAWKISEGISRPISKLSSASAAIAHGDFSQKLKVETADEVGSLTRAFNTMVHSLQERDQQLKERTRQQLTKSERMAAIGRLAAGVAHEINNPLTGVLTFSHLARDHAPVGSKQREDLEIVIDATNRCRKIVRGLLDFSRQNEPCKEMADLNDVLGRALDLVRNQLRIRAIDIIEEMDPDLPRLVIDPNQILEVALNLLVNAIDAMTDHGALRVGTRQLSGENGRWVEFEVTDTGCGIAEGDIERVFDPFFTTKPVGRGTGLGLAIAYGIVTEHGGNITVDSKVGQGTTIRVSLPVRLQR